MDQTLVDQILVDQTLVDQILVTRPTPLLRGCGVTSIWSYHCIDAPPATDFHVGFLRATWARQSYISWFIIDHAEL